MHSRNDARAMNHRILLSSIFCLYNIKELGNRTLVSEFLARYRLSGIESDVAFNIQSLMYNVFPTFSSNYNSHLRTFRFRSQPIVALTRCDHFESNIKHPIIVSI